MGHKFVSTKWSKNISNEAQKTSKMNSTGFKTHIPAFLANELEKNLFKKNEPLWKTFLASKIVAGFSCRKVGGSNLLDLAKRGNPAHFYQPFFVIFSVFFG